MKRLLFALVAVAAGIGALVAAIPLLSPPLTATVGRNVFVNPPGPANANSAPSLVRNPRVAGNLVMTHRVDGPELSAVISSSLDNGATWRVLPLPLPPGFDRPFDPDLAYGPDGTLFVSYVNLEGGANQPASVWVATSSDAGRSLSDPVRVFRGQAFEVRLAVDAANRAHLTWLQGTEADVPRPAGGPHPIVLSHSADQGTTWSPPAPISDAGRDRVGAATPVVDSDGHLVVLYDAYEGSGLQGDRYTLVVTRSEDGGRTFSPGVEIDAGTVARFPVLPSLAAGPDGVVYAAWADGRNGDEDVFVRRSADGGRRWDDAVRVNDNQLRDRTDQYHPNLAVAPDGRVDVLTLDRRNDPRDNVLTDAYLATSANGGKSFASFRMSSQSFRSRRGTVADPRTPVDLGSRLGLVSDDGGAVAAWTDTRLATDPTGRQDIAAAAATLAPATTERSRLAAVVLLLGLSLLALAGPPLTGRRRRWRRQGPPKDESLL